MASFQKVRKAAREFSIIAFFVQTIFSSVSVERDSRGDPDRHWNKVLELEFSVSQGIGSR